METTALSTSDYIALASIIVAIIIGVASWLISAAMTRRSLTRVILGYRMESSPLFSKSVRYSGLTVDYKGEKLDEPVLLKVEVFNLGNAVIECPPISIKTTRGATYIIPVQVEDAPAGYEEIWTIERADADQCDINLTHLNPGQAVKMTFLMDEEPEEMPTFICPLKGGVVKQVSHLDAAALAREVATSFLPFGLSAFRLGFDGLRRM